MYVYMQPQPVFYHNSIFWIKKSAKKLIIPNQNNINNFVECIEKSSPKIQNKDQCKFLVKK